MSSVALIVVEMPWVKCVACFHFVGYALSSGWNGSAECVCAMESPGRWRHRPDGGGSQRRVAHRQEAQMSSRQIVGCSANTGPLWCRGEVEHCTLYSLLRWDRLALLDASSSFLKCNGKITPSDWMPSWSECPPLILIARHRHGLPLACRQMW